jgi:hypothetical protein
LLSANYKCEEKIVTNISVSTYIKKKETLEGKVLKAQWEAQLQEQTTENTKVFASR